METTSTTKRVSYEEFLRLCGYTDPKYLPERRVACIFAFMFTHAIIVMRIGDVHGYDDRWCYSSYEKAKAGLAAWDGAPGTEPTGWHRHPDTGRRYDEDGNLYINK